MYRSLCCTVLVLFVGGSFCEGAEERKATPQKTARPLAKNNKFAALNARLKTLVAAGKLTEDEAHELDALVAGPAANKPKDAQPAIDLEAIGRKLKAAVAAGEMTEADAAEGGCGVVGLASEVPIAGRHLFRSLEQMRNRGNGKGGSITSQ